MLIYIYFYKNILGRSESLAILLVVERYQSTLSIKKQPLMAAWLAFLPCLLVQHLFEYPDTIRITRYHPTTPVENSAGFSEQHKTRTKWKCIWAYAPTLRKCHNICYTDPPRIPQKLLMNIRGCSWYHCLVFKTLGNYFRVRVSINDYFFMIEMRTIVLQVV